MIKAITFDLDGVYFTSDSFSNFKKELGVENFNDAYMTQFKQGILTEDQFWDLTRQEFGVTLSNQQITKLLANS